MEIPANVVTAVRAANQAREANNPRRPAVELRWRERTNENRTSIWTFKRNYKASLESVDGIVTSYAIHEVFEREKPARPVLIMKDLDANTKSFTVEEVKDHCERLIRILAKGYEVRFSRLELAHGQIHTENIRFIPYE